MADDAVQQAQQAAEEAARAAEELQRQAAEAIRRAEEAAASQPFGRLVDPQEAARAVAYLATAESGLMTGANIDFDQTVIGART